MGLGSHSQPLLATWLSSSVGGNPRGGVACLLWKSKGTQGRSLSAGPGGQQCPGEETAWHTQGPRSLGNRPVLTRCHTQGVTPTLWWWPLGWTPRRHKETEPWSGTGTATTGDYRMGPLVLVLKQQKHTTREADSRVRANDGGALAGSHPGAQRGGRSRGPDIRRDSMREVLPETPANRSITTKKSPGLCFWFTFWLSEASRSDDSHGGEKCHRHPA